MNVMRTLAYAFGAAGVLALAACLFAVVKVVTFQRQALHASGQVVALQVTNEYRKSTDTTPSHYVNMYAPIVEFDTPAGKQRVVGRVRSNVPDYRVGQRVDMLYPPGAPAAAVIDDFWQQWLLVVVLAPMALAFGGVGAGFGIYFWRRRRLFRWLDRFGLRVRLPCLGAKVDTSISSGLKHPWRVTCEWRDPTTMQVYRMQSDPVWPDPRPRIEGMILDVLLNPANPRQYRVNVDHLS